MTAGRWIAAGVAVGALGAVLLAPRLFGGMVPNEAADAGPLVPTALVTRGALDRTVHLKGELRAIRQVNLIAPSVGGTLRILDMRETGDAVSEGDVIVEFDPAEQLYALEQARSEVLEAEQEILKREADAAVQTAEDQVALLTARFDVRRAELDAAVDRDLIPANEYRIREVSLDEARRRLTQVEADTTSRVETSTAALAVLRERRAKAQMAADRAEQNIESLVVTAPIDGIVSIRENRDASGGVIFGGMSLPVYRVGDDVASGRPLIDVFDVSAMEIAATINEQERSSLEVGQAATVESDALPGVVFPASVVAISGLGRPVRNAGPLRQFDVTLELAEAVAGLRPGTSVRVLVDAGRLEDLLLVPRQAVFEREGKPVVFVPAAGRFETVEVKVLHRTETTVALEGLDEGQRVALVDPERAARPGSVAPPPAGGRL